MARKGPSVVWPDRPPKKRKASTFITCILTNIICFSYCFSCAAASWYHPQARRRVASKTLSILLHNTDRQSAHIRRRRCKTRKILPMESQLEQRRLGPHSKNEGADDERKRPNDGRGSTPAPPKDPIYPKRGFSRFSLALSLSLSPQRAAPGKINDPGPPVGFSLCPAAARCVRVAAAGSAHASSKRAKSMAC